MLVKTSGNPFVAVILALLASPVLLPLLRWTFEPRFSSVLAMFDPRTQSWTFVFGDTLFLPFAFAFASLAYQSVPADSIFKSWLYLGLCIGLGIGAGVAFHYGMQVPAYTDAGLAEALNSPTLRAHDFVAYPFLFGGLLYIGIPGLVHHWQWTGTIALVGVLLWGVAAVGDAIDPPQPKSLHPKWDQLRFCVIE